MTTAYAASTSVSVDRTKAEIEKLLTKHGASAVVMGWDQHVSSIMFDLYHRRIRFTMANPDPQENAATRTPAGKRRTADQLTAYLGQQQRQRWRALLLIIKAKLEAVRSGAVTADDEFLAYVVIPGTDETIADRVTPELDRAYAEVGYQPMLALPKGRT